MKKILVAIPIVTLLYFVFYLLLPKYQFSYSNGSQLRLNKASGKIELWLSSDRGWKELKDPQVKKLPEDNFGAVSDDVGFIPEKKTIK